MARRYFTDPLPPPGEHILPVEVSHHLSRVLRIRAGDQITLFDGRGSERQATIVSATRGSAIRAEVGTVPSALVGCEPSCSVELAFALPKGQRAEWLFEHGTEVGIRRFRPLICERSSTRMVSSRVRRWERITRAAAGQCDRLIVPQIDPVTSLDDLLAEPLPACRSVAHRQGPAGPVAPPADRSAAILVVGPEGGLSPAELDALFAADFVALGLGPLTLRTETAALVGAAHLLHLHS